MQEELILKALSQVIEPDLKKDLVSLNMIRELEFDSKSISFAIHLTTPACPLKDKMQKDCIEALRAEVGDGIEIKIRFTADVSSRRNADINILPNVKNIICVASGKGGVGKSTVSVNLALALAQSGAAVGLIDADIHGPSIPTMLGIKAEKPTVRDIKGKLYMLPIEKHGIKVLSIGLLVDERQAIVWRGPMVTSALKQFVTDCIWGKLDYLIIDMPPGTGDVHLSMIQTVQVSGAVIVSTPQEVALADARKAISMFRLPQLNVPVLGIVENMSYFSPPDMPEKKYYLFGENGGKELAEEYEMPFLGELPLVQSIRQAGDDGLPAVISEQAGEELKQAFMKLASRIAQQISIQNTQKQNLAEV